MIEILNVIKKKSDRTFLFQTKDPKTYNRIEVWPENVILGITLETNEDKLYQHYNISRAPLPSVRFVDFMNVKHSRKMVTIEPIIQFSDVQLVTWIKQLNLEMVWTDYESKNEKNTLPEPTFEEFKGLYEALRKCKRVHPGLLKNSMDVIYLKVHVKDNHTGISRYLGID